MHHRHKTLASHKHENVNKLSSGNGVWLMDPLESYPPAMKGRTDVLMIG